LASTSSIVGIPTPPGSVERLVVDRPPPGAARGVLPVPAAVVVLVALAVVLAVAVHLVVGARRR
jgi:hypothetical protein